MSETIKPPPERTHADYGVGPYLLAVTRTIAAYLLTGPDTPPERIDPDEQREKRWDFLNEIADNTA